MSMKIQYLEIVTPDVEGTIAIFAASNNAKFSDPVAELGNARVAKMPDGGQISVRAPMHAEEEPVTRTYFLTEDIDAATEQAVAAGAELAHPVMDIPGQGKFSIFFHAGNQFGYWQT
ncbi:MAG: hydroxylase [Hellea sp.]